MEQLDRIHTEVLWAGSRLGTWDLGKRYGCLDKERIKQQTEQGYLNLWDSHPSPDHGDQGKGRGVGGP